MMYKVLTLNKISPIGTNCFSSDKYSIVNEESNPDAIMLRSFNMHETELSQNLLAVARAGAGVNNVPVEKCAEKGIVAFNTPGANANAVKELVLCGLLLASRKVVQGINWAQSLKGQGDVAKLVEKGKGDFVGPEITGKKLGIVGLGAIGILAANAACDLGMEVYGYNPRLTAEKAIKLNPKVQITSDLDVILKNCDYISLHQPLKAETKYAFNEEAFAKMKDGVRILNFARNELVCNDAIKKAIETGKVASYVIDFPTEDILGIENIIAIPHLGASTPESEDNCAYMAANQLINYIENGNIVNSVNYPDCELAKSGNTRICILGKGFAIDEITSAVAAGNKITNMIHKSNDTYSYAMIDIAESKVESIDKITDISGVIKVRTLSC